MQEEKVMQFERTSEKVTVTVRHGKQASVLACYNTTLSNVIEAICKGTGAQPAHFKSREPRKTNAAKSAKKK